MRTLVKLQKRQAYEAVTGPDPVAQVWQRCRLMDRPRCLAWPDCDCGRTVPQVRAVGFLAPGRARWILGPATVQVPRQA